LRTPLTTIIGLARILARRPEDLDESELREANRQLLADAERLRDLIENMLALARLDRTAVELEPVLLQRVVRRAIDMGATRFPARAIVLDIDEHLPPVLGIETWVEQIVQNLIANAEKYSPADSTIDVIAAAEGGSAVVRVFDRGQGIDPAETEDLFQPFYRSNRNRRNIVGAGLGLAVCRRLLSRMDGRIWARQREGGGSEFAFSIPCIPSEPAA
jgi:two-component system sensor histidine kinase KdpD